MSTSDVSVSRFASDTRAVLLGAAAILALGMAAGSVALARGMVAMKRADREVTVRGVAERNVTANRASWSVNYSAQSYVLAEALAEVDRDSERVRRFLAGHGFSGATTRPGSANITVSDEYIGDRPTGRKTFSVNRTIAFTTDKVAQVQSVEAAKDELARAGLVVNTSAAYEYTALDTVKPDMIAEATRDARRAAEKFANDSGATVGGIKTATQGYFSVSSREAGNGGGEEYGDSDSTASSPDQRVRVVTTIDYYLD